MLRTLYTAAASSAFGAVAIGTMRERVQDQLWQPVEACSVGLVALAAVLVIAFILMMRDPEHGCRVVASDFVTFETTPAQYARFGEGHQPIQSSIEPRPAPPTGGSGVKAPNCVCHCNGLERLAR